MKYHVILPAGDTEDYIATFNEFVHLLRNAGYLIECTHYAGGRHESAFVATTDNDKPAEFLSNISMYDWINVCTFDTISDRDDCISELELEAAE